MPRTILVLLAALLLVGGLSGCSRWIGYAPVRIQGQAQNPDVVFQRLVRRAQVMGYYIQADPARRHFRVLAHLDQHKRKAHLRTSFFQVQVQPNGAVDVSAYGVHFRGGGSLIHRRLCAELTQFLDCLAQELDPSRPPVLVGLAY